MKTVKYTGVGVGPELKSGVLSKDYDFSNGLCAMEDEDAGTLVHRCGHSYAFTDEVIPEPVVAKPMAKPVAKTVKK